VPLIQKNPIFALIGQTVFYAPVLGYIYALVTVKYQLPFWKAFNSGKLTGRRLLRFVAGGIVLALVAEHMPTLVPDKDMFPLQELFSSTAAAYALAVFAVVVAPFMEELIFRGVLFNVFERQVGLGFAIAITALLFAGFHVPEYWGAWNHLLLVSLAGGVFSLARGITGSLAPSVLIHLGYNASVMTALFFETHHFHSWGALIVR
jgi:membrane protease YdiL (CAAX protease family)